MMNSKGQFDCVFLTNACAYRWSN